MFQKEKKTEEEKFNEPFLLSSLLFIYLFFFLNKNCEKLFLRYKQLKIEFFNDK